MKINVELKHTEDEIQKYFTGGANWPLWVSIIAWIVAWIASEWWVGLIVLFGLIAVFVKTGLWGDGPVKDEDIDEMWHLVASSREEEAYRVTNYDKEDVLRDAQYFFAYANDTAPSKLQLHKEGKDELYRWNHLKLVYMIFGRDQLIVFDETICLENLWDGADRTEEYYWEDVSSVTFDERTNTFQFAVGPRIISYPLSANDPDNGEDADERSAYYERANEVANAVRLILREKKAASRA